jgi:hypothetical protein
MIALPKGSDPPKHLHWLCCFPLARPEHSSDVVPDSAEDERVAHNDRFLLTQVLALITHTRHSGDHRVLSA